MRYLPTIRSVNVLFLISLVLVIVAGSAVQAWSPGWGTVITEVFLILLPAVLFLKILRYPLVETTRLRWPGGRPAALSLVIGVSFALLALWLGNLITTLFGYSFALPPEFYPDNALEAVVLFSALAFFAPLCEEFLFRGVIQRGYERRGPWTAILVVGLYFCLYHLSFQRLLAIAPVAAVLGYVAWRGRSLVASILVHAAYNAFAGVLLLLSVFRPEIKLDWFGSLPLAALGLVTGGLALRVFSRETMDDERRLAAGAAGTDVLSPDLPRPETSSWLGRAWPVAIALLLFLFLAGIEFVAGRFPQILARGPLQVRPASGWEAGEQWRYELRNILEEPVGQAQCSLAPEAGGYLLDCTVEQQAFEARQGQSFYKSGAYTLRQTARWDRASLDLLGVEGSQTGDGSDLSWQLVREGPGLSLAVTEDGRPLERLALPAGALFAGEWPWRLQGIPFSLSYSRRATLAWPLRWSQAAQTSLPLAEEGLVVVVGAEPLGTPAGRFIAWRVNIGDRTAWYDAQTPHRLLRFDDGDVISYRLVSIEPTGSGRAFLSRPGRISWRPPGSW